MGYIQSKDYFKRMIREHSKEQRCWNRQNRYIIISIDKKLIKCLSMNDIFCNLLAYTGKKFE